MVYAMRKAAQQKLVVVFLIVIFGMSSIAFIVSGFFGQGGTQQQFQPLQSTVIEGEIDAFTKDVYIQNGFTFLELIYVEGSPLYNYVNSLPSTFVTPSGQEQLFVQKIKGGGDKDTVTIINLRGSISVEPTLQGIEEELCRSLTVTPIECAFLLQNVTNTGTNASANASSPA